MSIIIAGGQSVTDYDRLELEYLCKYAFVFAVNDSAFKWPCDIVVAMDNSWIRENTERLLKLNKPMIIRWWDEFNDSPLVKANLITNEPELRLPNEIIHQFPLSGMLAAKLSDRISSYGDNTSYVLGMDATPGHYYDNGGQADRISLDEYGKLHLTNTVNLGVHSKISCWPKRSKLPRLEKVIIHEKARAIMTAWVTACAKVEIQK